MEKIKLLIADPKLAKQMGHAARKKAEEEFGPEGHYDQIISVYKKLTGS